MQSPKMSVALLMGGRSSEHEVSIKSAANIYNALKGNFEVRLIGVDRIGGWHILDQTVFDRQSIDASTETLKEKGGSNQRYIVDSILPVLPVLAECSAVFPILHGTYGEDGVVQGMLKLFDIPFVGADVLGSAVGMDKYTMKRLLRDAGLPIGDFVSFTDLDVASKSFESLKEKLGSPLFIKPSSQGSSVGVHRATDECGFVTGIKDAFQYDERILVERALNGIEVECAVLGNEKLIASQCGRILAKDGFYSYANKYLNEDGAEFQTPADISPELTKKVQELALKAFEVLECKGLARVDFFVCNGDQVFVNEINTLPGFTNISMYPMLFEVSGTPKTELVKRLVDLAIERHQTTKSKKTSR